MKILKYVLLLLLLFSVAFVVFVATQPSDYKIERSKEIKIAKETLFSFVSDSSVVENWNPWDQNEALFKNISINASDSLIQDIYINEQQNKSILLFQKTKKGTFVTWKLSGKLDFNLKILSVLKGGIENVLGNNIEQGLKNIDNYLIKELTLHTIKIDGLVTKHATNFIQQVDSCSITNFQKVSKKTLQNMMEFVASNEINVTGLPFVIYDKSSASKNNIIFSMCVPVEEEILTTEGSEISGGNFTEFLALKTTLVGDYSHRKRAMNKINAYILKNKLIVDQNGKQIEVYKISLPKERKPSKWVTEIYVPIVKKVVKPRLIKSSIVRDSSAPVLITPVEIPTSVNK